MKNRILYVEDEPSLGKIVKETLEKQGFEVLWEMDGNFVINHFSSFSPDLCILDIMLPNINGYSLCKKIHAHRPDLPIIFLTAKVETADLVKGFEAGGTDYIRKPFSLEELIVRINNQLKLRNALAERKDLSVKSMVKIGRYTFYPDRYELQSPNNAVKLSQRELEVLNILVSNINKVSDRKNILMQIWGDDSFFNSRNLDVYIQKLRQHFREDKSIIIQTLKGKGYLFLAPTDYLKID